MSRFAFPYGIRFQEDGRIEVFPAVEVFILGLRGKGLRATLYVDSGATTSVLPIGDAEILGINMSRGEKMIVRGISGEPLAGYRHFVKIQLGGCKLKIPAIFVEYDSLPRILGREGVFSSFVVLFDEVERRTGFLDAKRERKVINLCFPGPVK